MQGVLLESGNVDRYLALGKSGRPVFESSQQILAALQRHPDLLRFFAVPQRNEKGSSIDWYSPVPGHVIAWSNASDAEREQARLVLESFTQQVHAIGAAQIKHGIERQKTDTALFGELLQEACKIPSAQHIYLVDVAETGAPVTPQGQPVAELVGSGAGRASLAAAEQGRLQPVLTFWGFVNNEGDRHRQPLYFLEPLPAPAPEAVAPMPAAAVVQAPAAVPAAALTPVAPPVAVPPVVPPVTPWWRRWWMWLLLVPLLLLGLWLLRGCMPGVAVPAVGGLPALSGNVALPDVSVAGGAVPALEGAGAALPGVPGMEPVAGGLAPAGLPELGAQPAAAPALEAGQASQPALPSLSADPAEPALPALPEPSANAAPPAALEIPKGAADGVANFLNGKYRTRGGLMDQQTSQPLSLHYDFKDGKGQVQIKRPGGVTCKGNVLASMNKGQLGIQSEGAAACSDGSQYDMPKVVCKAGATSVADCMGAYGSSQFPIQMQSNN